VLGAILAALSAASFGLNNAMTRRGVLTGSVGQALAIGVPMFFLFALAGGGLGAIPNFPRDALLVITATGVLVTVSQMFFYMALVVAPVSVVMPILQLHLVFRFLMARLMNPHHEMFGGMMILATALSMIGAAALSLDPEFVIAHVPLPESIVSILRWRLL
jgi:uncharacterized membrane protein